MKKLATTALITFGLVGLTSPALAEAADVVRSEGCGVFDANGDLFFDTNARVQIVSTNNNRATMIATCQAQLPAPGVLPDRALRFNFENTGISCLGINEEWQQVVTPSGQAHLTCRFPVEDF